MNIQDFTKETNLGDIGVYMITHKSTDIKYIGSTISKDGFGGRWRAHLNGWKRGIGNTVLLNILNKYGLEGFEFHVVERLTDSSLVRARERYWIDYYDTYHHGANCTEETSCAFLGYDRAPYTEEQKLMYRETSPTKKTVYLYDKKGNLLHIFPSTVACDKYFGLRKGRTNWIVNHPIRSIQKQYYPSYELKTWNPEVEVQASYKQRALLVASLRKRNNTQQVSNIQKSKIRESNPCKIPVALYTISEELVNIFSSMNECDDYLGLARGTTSKVLKGKAKTLKRKYIPKII